VFSPIGLALPLVKDGRLVALAVSTAARAPALPEVPTLAEAALPGFEFDTWYGLFAPAATPRLLLARISSEVSHLLTSPEVKERLATRGSVAKSSTPQEFDRFVRSEMEKLAGIVKAAGVKAQ